MRTFFALISFTLVPLAFIPAARAQDDVNITPRVRPKRPEAPQAGPRPDIRVDTTLVLIPVSVSDPLGKFVTGMEKENFKLYEDKVEQQITDFSSEDAPMSIGIVFDTSGSMGSKLAKSREAVAQFMKVANPDDEFFLIQFNSRAQLETPFTSRPEEILNKLMYVRSKGSTALLDAVYLGMNQMRKARNPRKAILIISDGGDNSSRYTQSEVKDAVREADVQVYAMGIFEAAGFRPTPEEMAGPGLLQALAKLTGGHSFEVGNVAELPDVSEKIAIELRNEYMLGYTPKNETRDGKYRRVQVKIQKISGLPPLRASFRTGYYAPSQ